MPSAVAELPAAIIAEELARVRERAPLVHVLTNEVVQALTANALLAVGASPAMIVAEEEAGEFATMADALLINVGTLHAPRLAAMRAAVAGANRAGRPWVLDPVAVGLLAYRTDAVRELLELRPAAIRANASEVLALAGGPSGAKGVDSTAASEAALQAARRLAAERGTIVALSGATDFITDGVRTWAVSRGHALMTRVTGTGCALSAVVAAFLGTAPAGAPGSSESALRTIAAACGLMAICGEQAAGRSHGPGSFVPAFLDELYRIQPEELLRRER